jgi:hypothetical protein
LLPLAGRHWPRWGFWLGAATFLLLAWWLVTHRIDRFWLPALPLLALLAAVGADWSTQRFWRRTVNGVLAAALLACFLVNSSSLIGDNRYFVELEQLRDNARLSPVSLVHRYLNEHVEPGQRVLLVGDAAVFYLRMPLLYSTCFDDCPLELLIRGRSAADRRRALAERRIAYVYVNWAEIRRYRRTYGFTEYITAELFDRQLVRQQGILRPVPVAGLDARRGTLYKVTTGPERK